MNSPSVRYRLACALTAVVACAAFAGTASAAAEADVPLRASVDWTDPTEFDEVKDSHGRGMIKSGVWLGELKKHLERRATRVLPNGQRLEVTFTDIKLAGAFEPWRGPQFDDVRIVKDIYAPRINLRFTLKLADGSVIESGERKLRDLGFLSRSIANTSDTLRYEKRMLDEWLYRDFVRDKATAAR